jgi:hypothetical protein
MAAELRYSEVWNAEDNAATAAAVSTKVAITARLRPKTVSVVLNSCWSGAFSSTGLDRSEVMPGG